MTLIALNQSIAQRVTLPLFFLFSFILGLFHVVASGAVNLVRKHMVLQSSCK